MKKRVLPIVGVFMACMPLNHSTAATIDFSSLSIAAKPSKEITYVDKHVVFVLDRSSSMTSKELSILRDSIVTAFNNDETMDLAFSSGKTNAITFVSFASLPHTSKTHIVRDAEEALSAVNNILFNNDDPEKDSTFPSLNIGTTTEMNGAMKEVAWLFHDGETHRGIQSSSKAVIVIGDDPPQDQTLTKATVQFLQNAYHASFFCIPIVDKENITMSDIAFGTDFYMSNLRTPKGGLKIPNQYGGEDTVPEGLCLVTQNAETGSRVIAKAFAPVGG